MQRLAGDTVKGCVGGKSGHICKALPQPQAKAKAGPFGKRRRRCGCSRSRSWQRMAGAATAHGPGQGRGSKSSSSSPKPGMLVVPSANLPSGEIGDQAGTARLGGGEQEEVAGVPMGLFSQGSTAPFLLAFLASFLSRAYSLSRFGTWKYQAAFPTCHQLTPSSLNSIMCESKLPSGWSP